MAGRIYVACCHSAFLSLLCCAEGESLTSLSAEAAKKALVMAGVDPLEVDIIILCTSTPEDVFGSAGQVRASPLACNQFVSSR